MEIWKDVINYERIYKVSNKGRVKRIDKKTKRLKNGFLKLSEHYKGYLTVKLIDKRFFVQRLVTRAFLGKRPKNLQTNHKDCNKKNNNVENLEYVTQKQNMEHAVKNGLRPSCKGKKNPFYGKKHKKSSILLMKNKIFSKETRMKMSISAKKRCSNESI